MPQRKCWPWRRNAKGIEGQRRREENFRGSGRKEDTEGDFLSGTHNLFSLLFFFFACGRRGEFGRVLLCLLTKLNEKFCAVALSPLPHSRHANRKKSLLLVPTTTKGGDCVSFTFVSLIVFFHPRGFEKTQTSFVVLLPSVPPRSNE